MSGNVVVCHRCQTENPAGAIRCKKCHGSLTFVPQGSVPTVPPAAPSVSPPARTERKSSVAGIVVAAIGFLWLGYTAFDLVSTEVTVRELRDSLSAMQVTQLYTQSSFWVLLAIGGLLAGILYVVSTR
jgi:hypothetical protein